ncbi:MAG: hypothetical protein ACNI3C_02545 [Candidatus Marinarcus sp.]|uniref:hypothetical protein n=1 Tax=Candidatus Marinarcus sp. TaxID=3100987 RepID=UPI003AFFCF9F
MRTLQNFKVEVFFTLLLFLTTHIYASTNKYILSHDDLIDPRAIEKILEIGTEVETKTGVKIYLYVKDDYGIDRTVSAKEKFEQIKSVEENIIKELKTPYALLTMSLEQTHVNLIVSNELKKVIDKDEILNDYVIPLLASKDKNLLLSKVSAAALNGYAQIADDIASSQNITLESSIGNSGKTIGTIWRVFIYFIVIVGLILYTVAVLRSKKR